MKTKFRVIAYRNKKRPLIPYSGNSLRVATWYFKTCSQLLKMSNDINAIRLLKR